MKLSCVPYDLVFKHPFGVSSNVRTKTTSVFVKIESEGQEGYGEACVPEYLGEKVSSTIEFLKKAKDLLINYDATLPLNFLLNDTAELSTADFAAKAALDIALHDLYGKLHNKSYSEMMGIPQSMARSTSFTIALDNENKLEEKIKEAEEFSILKIKAGSGDDKALINTIRKFTDKPLFVDVNQGWQGKEFVLDMLLWMKDQKVLLVEQPMKKGEEEDMAWVTERSPTPTIADESVKRLEDLEKIDGAFSGVNIKLMKCTGLREAMRMINYCKKNDLKIMLGCMAESSCGTTAMAQLMQFADFVDLDAPLLYTNDPFKGVYYHNGKVNVSNLPGIGVLSPTVLEFLP